MNHRLTWLILLLLSLTLVACGGGGSSDNDTSSGDSIEDGDSQNSGDDSDDDDDDGDSGGDGGVSDVPGTHQVLAFNDLGMHCADLDYSNFVILPPFNVLHSQVIERGERPTLLDESQASVSYYATGDASGSINTTSQNLAGSIDKSNFWDTNPDTGNRYVFDLFGLDPQPDEGLMFGQAMPGISDPYNANAPQAFNDYDSGKAWFSAHGIPILPIDDLGQLNAYPLMRVEAADTMGGTALASIDVVLPVASEADCQNCHASGEIAAPLSSSIDFVLPDDITDPNAVLQAAKQNIMLLHDARHGTQLMANRPVLCASCHYSAALDLTASGPNSEQLTHDTMSEVMHGYHGRLTDADSGQPVFPSPGSLEDTCYQCHPGKTTQCLRGAMGGAGIVCQDCHGSMLAVGQASRQAWSSEPRCESCHTGDASSHLGTSIRQNIAWDGDIDTATPRTASNKRFAENDATLYRNSLGHGGVACEGCHGSPHAIWPNANPQSNDNIAATQLQGHAGTLSDCGVCHTSLPLTLNGPHGMHNVNSSSWNLNHEGFYERDPAACRSCHGQNLEGTVLSQTAADRDYLRDDDGNRAIHLVKGTPVSCNLCHGTPGND
ncbi:MAG: cytochrome C [Candidatus Thiodiazotropha sp.]